MIGDQKRQGLHLLYETNTQVYKSATGEVGNCINLHSNAISQNLLAILNESKNSSNKLNLSQGPNANGASFKI